MRQGEEPGKLSFGEKNLSQQHRVLIFAEDLPHGSLQEHDKQKR